MTILGLLITLAIFGFVLWLLVSFVPMPEPVRTIVIAIATIFLIIWLLQTTGLLGGTLNTRIRLG